MTLIYKTIWLIKPRTSHFTSMEPIMVEDDEEMEEQQINETVVDKPFI